MCHKLCGKIPLETIVSVEECETQPGECGRVTKSKGVCRVRVRG